ncbi:uncharacterized protein C3orf38-like [Mobula hypostoma]|uniref:uncharacterized protein C3orf38-like n=1 Tax=Mobula hypostoma TaxID=723540 RepID=UPI002FC2A553
MNDECQLFEAPLLEDVLDTTKASGPLSHKTKGQNHHFACNFNRRIANQCESRKDLIGVILNHTQSAEELLKRRKVRHEDILKYLINQGVVVSTSSDKQQLITVVLEYWSTSEAQRRGCSEILKSLSCDNLLGLKDTIVSGLTTVDLIGIILNHSQSAEELLKRRKVRHEDILKYLIKHGVAVSTSSDKQQLITVVLEYWSNSEVDREPLISEADLELRDQTVMEELERQVEQLRRQQQMLNLPQGATAMDLNINVNISQN